MCESVYTVVMTSRWMKGYSDKKHGVHEDDGTDYKFAVITSHTHDLTRQFEEAIRIKQAWRKFRLLTTN